MTRAFRFVALVMVGAGLVADTAPAVDAQDVAGGRTRGRAIAVCMGDDPAWYPRPPRPRRPRPPRPFLGAVALG
jgi:hypothetical protein